MESTSEVTIRVPAQADRSALRGEVADGMRLRVRHVYAPEERPVVLVHVNGDWQRGVLRKWSQDPAGGWWGSVAWGRSPGARFLVTVRAERIWEDGGGPPPGT